MCINVFWTSNNVVQNIPKWVPLNNTSLFINVYYVKKGFNVQIIGNIGFKLS